LLRDRLRAGEDPLTAVTDLVSAVEAAAPGSRLNLLLTDGEVLVGTTWTHSLSVLSTTDAVVVASEPTGNEPGWRPVPERHAVRVQRGAVEFIRIGQHQQDRSA
jgi:glutamine amidotransferase